MFSLSDKDIAAIQAAFERGGGNDAGVDGRIAVTNDQSGWLSCWRP